MAERGHLEEPESAGTRGTILVVDDAPAIRDTVSDLLGDEGYTVLTAVHGREALERLRGGLRPDLILLDLIMPVMDGWTFLEQRAKDPALLAIPVVVVSATPEVADIPSTCGFIRKPMKLNALLEVVQREGRPPRP